MSEFKFGHPYKYDNWYIFPNTTLDNLQLDDCISSVTGKCENKSTVQDCIKLCQESKNCFAGYFIETPDKQNICVPINKILGGPSLGPYYRLRNQNIYPELKGMTSSVFTSPEYEFPPKHANYIFYTDKFVLTNILSGKNIGTNNTDKNTVLSSEDDLFLQFLPDEILRNYVSRYLIIRNGDEVSLSIPGTSYFLKNDGENISWVMRISSIEASDNKFRVFSANKNKKIGDFLDYSDTLYFTSSNQKLSYDSNLDSLKLSPQNVEENSTYFKITPKISVYYCENGKCKNILLEHSDMSGSHATYKGHDISRNPNCWGLCDQGDKKNKLWLLSIPIILIFVIVLFFVLKKNYVF